MPQGPMAVNLLVAQRRTDDQTLSVVTCGRGSMQPGEDRRTLAGEIERLARPHFAWRMLAWIDAAFVDCFELDHEMPSIPST